MNTYILFFMAIIFLLALLLGIKFYREANDRKEKVNSEKMLMDVFEMQIKMPELSLIYDSVRIEASKEFLQSYELKKEAFIIYYLSIFDLVVDYYYGRNSFASKDSAMKEAWVNTIKNFFRDSSDGRNIYMEHKSEFNKRFQVFVDKVLENIKI